METFINNVLKIDGKLFVDRDLAVKLANVCLPVFFATNFPVEKMNWDSVEQYSPFIFTLKQDDVNDAIYSYLINNGYEQAYFLNMFNNEFIRNFANR